MRILCIPSQSGTNWDLPLQVRRPALSGTHGVRWDAPHRVVHRIAALVVRHVGARAALHAAEAAEGAGHSELPALLRAARGLGKIYRVRGCRLLL